MGSPVDPVPQSVREALAAASDAKNAHGYPVTAGSGDLRDAIFEWFRAVRGVGLQSINADVVPTVGSKEAVALMASLLHLGEGDVVVQPKVSYPTYEIGTQLAGASVLKVDDVSDVDSWCHVPGVKAVWVNSPCNPTGRRAVRRLAVRYRRGGASHRRGGAVRRVLCPDVLVVEFA